MHITDTTKERALAANLHKIKQTAQHWRYDGGKRDLRLDAIRGFAVLAMVIDHISGDDSWLYTITAHNRFFISAAEPFVFISGLVMGIVYASLIARKGLGIAVKKAAKRVALLYALNVFLSIGLALLSLELDLEWAPHWGKEGLVGFVMSVVTMHKAYYLTDVLLLYALLVTAAVPLMALLARRRAWINALVLAVSGALWLAWQLWPQQVQIPWAITDNDVFHFAAWQVLFVPGMVIGFNRRALSTALGKIGTRGMYAILGVSGALVGVSIAAYLWLQDSPSGSGQLAIAHYFQKGDLSIGRLVVFAIFAVFAITLLSLAWRPFNKVFGWLLLPLGQNALNAYGLHIFFVALSTAFIPQLLGDAANHVESNTAVQLLGIGLIWLVIMLTAPVKAFIAQRRKQAVSWLLATPSGTRSAVTRTPRGWKVQPRLALAMAACFALLTSGTMATVAAAGPARQTLHALNEKGRNTVVFVPTVTAAIVGTPGTAPSAGQAADAPSTASKAPLAANPAASPEPASTPVPGRSPIVPDGGGLALRTAPETVATTTPGAVGSPTPLPAGAQTHTFMSQALGRTMSYIIYLPPGYDSNTTTRYPVLYMLHGIGSDNTEWVRYGLIGWADELMRANMIKPFIIVLPNGEQSYWVDQANGGPKWGAYTAQDVVAEVDSHYRTIADRSSRAIGGISMGGHAALQLAINYPGVFGIAGAHSPSLHPYDSAPSFFGDEAWFEAHDPSHLFTAHPEIARTVKLWVDVGSQDAWLPIVNSFHRQLQSEDIPHQWHIFQGDTLTGGHTGEYWSTHIPDYLRFYSSAFPN